MRKITALIIILIFSTLLAACAKEKINTEGKDVDIFYLDSKTSGLVKESYTLIGTETEDRIKELMYMLQKNPDTAVYKNALPKDVTVTYTYNDSGSMLVDYSTAYNELSKIDKILCCAAIVKTVSQISDVMHFQFSVGGQPLPESDGIARSLTAEDFVDNTEATFNYKAKLYYANKKGDELVEYIVNLDNSGDESIEERVIQQLINGPTELGMYRTVPEGTVLLNVSKAENICTVDFNEKFLNKLPEVSEDVAIYSIVNTLIDLPNINRVQFTINGKAQKKYFEDIAFDSAFEQNLDLIESAD